MSYEDELIQVAAVAVAMLEDESFDVGADGRFTEDVLGWVADERKRQNKKWGPQHHDPTMWLTILMEEVGEAAQAHLHMLEDHALTGGIE